MITRYWHMLLGLWLLQLSGCAQIPTQTSIPSAWSPPTGEVWALKGRVAVWVGEEGWHATLTWTQTADDFRIELAGPLGQGALRLHGDADGVDLERADGVHDHARNADELLERHTGWALPADGLRYWVRGLAVPDRPADWQRDSDGLPQRLRQSGWSIRYVRFSQQPGLGLMPQRIDLERDGIRVRLVADSWTGSAEPG